MGMGEQGEKKEDLVGHRLLAATLHMKTLAICCSHIVPSQKLGRWLPRLLCNKFSNLLFVPLPLQLFLGAVHTHSRLWIVMDKEYILYILYAGANERLLATFLIPYMLYLLRDQKLSSPAVIYL
jgi:hypothetical protein